MEEQLKSETITSSRSHPSEPYSYLEKDKSIPSVLSMSPEYSKYRDGIIIGSIILMLFVFLGGACFLIYYFHSSILGYFGIEKKMRISVILMETRTQAEAILKVLNDGTDFDSLARLYSFGPSKEEGGDLGYIEAGYLMEELDIVALKLKVGEYSDIVETKDGYYILMKTDEKLSSDVDVKHDKSDNIYKKAIEINPKDAYAYNNRGVAYYKDGQYEKAISDYSKAIEINPNLTEAYLNRGITFDDIGQHNKAISDYSKAIEINPNLAEAYHDRGIAYTKENKYNEAISDFNKAIEINPDDFEAYNNRGIVYYKEGQYDKAISDYSKAIEINPRDANAYYKRGYTYVKQGQYEKAISDYNKIIEINPIDALAYVHRGYAFFYKKEFEKAWDDVHKAQDLGHQIDPEFIKALREASGREE